MRTGLSLPTGSKMITTAMGLAGIHCYPYTNVALGTDVLRLISFPRTFSERAVMDRRMSCLIQTATEDVNAENLLKPSGSRNPRLYAATWRSVGQRVSALQPQIRAGLAYSASPSHCSDFDCSRDSVQTSIERMSVLCSVSIGS